MITDKVINEIYRKFNKPHKNESDLNLDYFMELLNENHSLVRRGPEIVVEDLEEGNLFRRFLVRSLNTVLEFDKMVAFVFRTHILFFGKEDNALRVHWRREEPKQTLWGKIFGKGN